MLAAVSLTPRRARLLAVAFLSLLVLTVLAGSASGVQAAVPANLCTLDLKHELSALHVSSNCSRVKLSKLGAIRIHGASYGALTDSVNVQVYTGQTKAAFQKQFGSLGAKVKLGSFAREEVSGAGISVSVWVNGIGLVTTLSLAQDPEKNQAFASGLLDLTAAVIKQL